MNLKKYKLKDIGNIKSGGTPSTKIKEYWDGEIKWITPKDLSSNKNKYISNGERNITNQGLKNSNATLLPTNTVLMSSRAPIGYLAIAKNPLTTNQGFKSIICNKNLCDYNFIYYWLKNNIKFIKNNSNGSTFQEISGSTFKNLKIDLPNLNVQKKIAYTLSNLDSAIFNNENINQNITILLIFALNLIIMLLIVYFI